MLLTVNKNLNIRIGSPSTSASCPGFLKPGDNIDLDTILPGNELDGNAIWYKSKKGYYYWSGGVTEVDFEWPGIVLTSELRYAIVNDILHNYCSKYRKDIPGYIGCGAGTDENGNPVIKILVDKRKGEVAVSPFIVHKGVRLQTLLELVPTPVLHGFRPGDDVIGELKKGSAAVAVKFDGHSQRFLLGSYHVMASRQLKHNKTIVDDKDNLSVTLKNNSGGSIVLKVFEGEFSALYDYAIAVIPDDINWHNKYEHISISGAYTELDVRAAVGEFVKSLGAITQSRAQVLDGLYEVTLEGYSFKQVVRTQRLSVPGDSGAVVIGNDKRVIGIILGGDEDGNSYLIPAYQLVKRGVIFT